MLPLRFLAALFACCWLALPASAANTLQAIPALSGPVVDLTGTLDAAQQQALSNKIRTFKEKYGPQLQVLIIPTSAPEDAFSYSMRVVEEWKLGDKERDDGLLLFIAKNDRAFQLQVGYGLEGTVPDAIASRLLNEVMVPYFKQGDFYGGINALTDALFAKISGDASLAPVATKKQQQLPGESLLVFAMFAFAGMRLLKELFGWQFASVVGGPLAFLGGWWFVGLSVMAALVAVLIVLPLALSPGLGGIPVGHGGRRGGYGGGFGGGGFGGGGGWSGGGGGFGGGGAGGRW